MKRKEIRPEHQELMKQLGKKIKDLRTKKKISYIKMAEEIGISKNVYNSIELGKVYWNFSSLLLVLDFHKISLQKFIKNL
jgi:DNA-binding XRE family transcriptional regulator